MSATREIANLSRRNMPQATWKQWIPAMVWLGVIALQSTDLASSEHTTYLLSSLLTHLFGQVDPMLLFVGNHYLRKAGHVFGYAILSYLLFRAWRATLPVSNVGRWALRWASTAWFMTVLVASLDEWHQAFIPSRTGTIADVILDSSAALAAQIVIWTLLRSS